MAAKSGVSRWAKEDACKRIKTYSVCCSERDCIGFVELIDGRCVWGDVLSLYVRSNVETELHVLTWRCYSALHNCLGGHCKKASGTVWYESSVDAGEQSCMFQPFPDVADGLQFSCDQHCQSISHIVQLLVGGAHARARRCAAKVQGADALDVADSASNCGLGPLPLLALQSGRHCVVRLAERLNVGVGIARAAVSCMCLSL